MTFESWISSPVFWLCVVAGALAVAFVLHLLLDRRRPG
jgi:hypothetical protein